MPKKLFMNYRSIQCSNVIYKQNIMLFTMILSYEIKFSGLLYKKLHIYYSHLSSNMII